MIRYLILFLSLLSFSSYAKSEVSCGPDNCMIVIDAGSTGSRAHLYAYDLDEHHTPTHIKELWSNRMKPGFATLKADMINDYMGRLLSTSPAQQLPVFFYATGGMRLISNPKQQELFTSLNQWFSNNSQWQLKDARVITGQEEATFAWLAVNDKLGTLTGNKPLVGIMDMGGASVQIAFPLNHYNSLNQVNPIELDLYGKHISLYAKSVLGIGLNTLAEQFLDDEECYPEAYPLPTNRNLSHGDAFKCKVKVDQLINQVHQVNNSLSPVVSQNQGQTWYVLGGLTAMITKAPFEISNNSFTPNQLIEQTDNKICKQSWSSLNRQFSDNEYLYVLCLAGSYYTDLLTNGYGLTDETSLNILPSNQEIDWTTGVVIHH